MAGREPGSVWANLGLWRGADAGRLRDRDGAVGGAPDAATGSAAGNAGGGSRGTGRTTGAGRFGGALRPRPHRQGACGGAAGARTAHCSSGRCRVRAIRAHWACCRSRARRWCAWTCRSRSDRRCRTSPRLPSASSLPEDRRPAFRPDLCSTRGPSSDCIDSGRSWHRRRADAPQCPVARSPDGRDPETGRCGN